MKMKNEEKPKSYEKAAKGFIKKEEGNHVKENIQKQLEKN